MAAPWLQNFPVAETSQALLASWTSLHFPLPIFVWNINARLQSSTSKLDALTLLNLNNGVLLHVYHVHLDSNIMEPHEYLRVPDEWNKDMPQANEKKLLFLIFDIAQESVSRWRRHLCDFFFQWDVSSAEKEKQLVIGCNWNICCFYHFLQHKSQCHPLITLALDRLEFLEWRSFRP